MRYWMLGTLAILGAPLAEARAVPSYDISAIKPYLAVDHDGRGHYVVRLDSGRAPPKKRIARPIFYGNGKVFYEVSYFSASRNSPKPADFSYTFHEPRLGGMGYATFSRRHGALEMQCGRGKVGFTPLQDAEARRMIAKARFFRPLWRRRSELLARDDEGRYFFVDSHRELEHEDRVRRDLASDQKRGLRLYVGPRGRMKRVPLKNWVVDPAGEIYLTAEGKLKRDAATKKVTWTEKGMTVQLTSLNLRDRRTTELIYRYLGPYRGARLGTPCDDL